MEKYIKAELEVIKITSEDIVTASDGSICFTDGSGDDDVTPVVPVP